MSRFRELLAPKTTVRAHCDLPCGVYDPEQARIEAESCYKIIEKMGANSDPTFTTRNWSVTVGLAPEVFMPFADALHEAGVPAG